MTTFKTLIVGAAVGALLAVAGVAAAMAVLNPTAGDVATEMADQANAGGTGGKAAADPNEPPNFYGAR
ncbi:hypothetical protein [Paractinoplanes toevensis]|uniref:DUF2613 family protein n=1 Tax=Paractinoplanes toevensis TaxID=571911 RepID=A0A919W855_9ACTN|nr:hypothetical protein [Actinoplanes toevensis]GIM92091.1 hypothetical protein Ato02nite_038840 [Actinoplanes toevensis]